MGRSADAQWDGGLKSGTGTVSFEGFEGGYTFKSRFEDAEAGTNPEELIAAAHAACFSMAFASELEKAGYQPQSVRTHADVRVRGGNEPPIDRIQLTTTATVPGIEDDELQRIAAAAKAGCPVSQALAAVPEITLEATLE